MIKFKFEGNIYDVPAMKVAFDGCHKIYLCATMEEVVEALGYSYNIHEIEELPTLWDKSCGLRFISCWDVETKKPLISQCGEANNTEVYSLPDGDIMIEVDTTKMCDCWDCFTVEELLECGVIK